MSVQDPAGMIALHLDALMRHWLQSRPDLAGHIAGLAEGVAAMARQCERLAVHPSADGSTPNDGLNDSLASVSPHSASATKKADSPSNEASVGGAGQSARVIGRMELKPLPPMSGGIVPLRIGDSVTHVPVKGTSADIAAARMTAAERQDDDADHEHRWDHFAQPDLGLMQTRCALKVRACDVAVRKRAAMGTDGEVEVREQIRALLGEARALERCFIWQVFPNAEPPPDAVMQEIRACYANLRLAAGLAERVGAANGEESRRQVLEMMAEAQSALRVALHQTWLTKADQDQEDAFTYLKMATQAEQVFLYRHMKLDDGADPAGAAALLERMEAFERSLTARQTQANKSRVLLNKVKYHARLAARDGDGEGGNWEKIEAAAEGLSAKDPAVVREFASYLAGLEDRVPGEETAPAIARLLQRNAKPPEVEPAHPDEGYSPDVLRVRDALRGTRVVMVGGERRDETARDIERAFELKELEWVALGEHASSAPAEAPIAHASTSLVLLLIKLTGHHHADDVRRFSQKHKRTLVRMPAGYNPEQIAAQAIAQASGHLRLE